MNTALQHPPNLFDPAADCTTEAEPMRGAIVVSFLVDSNTRCSDMIRLSVFTWMD